MKILVPGGHRNRNSSVRQWLDHCHPEDSISFGATNHTKPGGHLLQHEVSRILKPSVSRLGYLKVLTANFLTITAQIFGNILGFCKKWHFLRKLRMLLFWQLLEKIWPLYIPTSCHTAYYLLLNVYNGF